MPSTLKKVDEDRKYYLTTSKKTSVLLLNKDERSLKLKPYNQTLKEINDSKNNCN
jgi:hypothetical protein